MTLKVSLSDIDLGEEEIERVAEVLRSRWLSMGDVTREFETRFADFLGVRHAFLVANGTAALHLAHLAVGVRARDEVIVPALTFVATVNAGLYCGATAVFADINGPEDLNISAADIERKLGPRTRAITVMHYGGYMVDMDEIVSLARERGLAVIEDAAHAPGASRGGAMAGTIGDVGCFSFFSNKNLVTGEGGAVLTNDDEIAEEIRLLRSHGMTSLSYDRDKGHAFSYDVVRLGYNYRATEITAALAIVQLSKLQRNNAWRLELTRHYRRRLVTDQRLGLPFADYPGHPSCHLMPVLLPPATDRDYVMAVLRQRGIQTSVHYPPVHRFIAYRDRGRARAESLAWTEEVAARQLTLPLHPRMCEEDVDNVANALSEALNEVESRR